MEKNFICPVCGATCGSLVELKNCILEHEIAEKKAKQNEKEMKIKELKDKNENLIKEIKKNCEQLKELGVNASIQYNVIPNRQFGRSEVKSSTLENNFKNLSSEDKENFKIIDDFFNCIFGKQSE